jgi:hypothetical protein
MAISAEADAHPAPAIDDCATLNVGTRDASNARARSSGRETDTRGRVLPP